MPGAPPADPGIASGCCAGDCPRLPLLSDDHESLSARLGSAKPAKARLFVVFAEDAGHHPAVEVDDQFGFLHIDGGDEAKVAAPSCRLYSEGCSGSRIDGSSFRGEFTRVDIGHIVIGSGGNGASRSRGSTSRGDRHRS
jgi:hypothetical protein